MLIDTIDRPDGCRPLIDVAAREITANFNHLLTALRALAPLRPSVGLVSTSRHTIPGGILDDVWTPVDFGCPSYLRA